MPTSCSQESHSQIDEQHRNPGSDHVNCMPKLHSSGSQLVITCQIRRCVTNDGKVNLRLFIEDKVWVYGIC